MDAGMNLSEKKPTEKQNGTKQTKRYIQRKLHV